MLLMTSLKLLLDFDFIEKKLVVNLTIFINSPCITITFLHFVVENYISIVVYLMKKLTLFDLTLTHIHKLPSYSHITLLFFKNN